jgi:hypothetical protein
LQLGDIIADHEMTGNVMHDAVTELPARFLDASICVTSDDSVNGQSTFLLEGSNRPIDILVERVTGAVKQTDVHESGPNLGDRRADVTATQVHYR